MTQPQQGSQARAGIAPPFRKAQFLFFFQGKGTFKPWKRQVSRIGKAQTPAKRKSSSRLLEKDLRDQVIFSWGNQGWGNGKRDFFFL